MTAKFKVGDKVKVLYTANDAPERTVGMTGVVKVVEKEFWDDTQANGVSFENEDYVWWYVSEELELVE